MKKTTTLLLALLLTCYLATGCATTGTNGQASASVPINDLVPPYKDNVYGPRIGSDSTGKPFEWKTRQGQNVPFGNVTPDVYGPGIGMDGFGRPVIPQPLW